jgi:ubiquinone/menaquinone biosynthesis C-methylase UbiE
MRLAVERHVRPVYAVADSKQAEKTYLSRTGGRAWEREKPFPPAGTEMFDESLDLLNDFVVAMRLLQPSPDDRILDLGAGAGWCSDLLLRLNRKPVAVDIAHEMLAVARERRTARPIAAVAGDLEQLPFADGSFDKAVCLSAIHHVPDMAAAIAEIARVLTPTGVAVFSEPGVGHARMPGSVRATNDFGVLEQDVLIEPFTEMCVRAGFQHAAVCPIAYVIPEFELAPDDWRAWRTLPRTKRPLRALEKMWRALLELAGAAKKTVLFEEAFAMRLVRLLQVPVEEHPFIVAAKSSERRRPRAVHRADISVQPLRVDATPDTDIAVVVEITNAGTAAWRARSADGVGHVRIGIQLLDAASRMIDRDFARVALTGDVAPGESTRVTATFRTPVAAGDYELKVDLVAEGVTWFEPGGSTVAVVPLRVREAAPRSAGPHY